MAVQTVTLGMAFGAGLVSFFSPCVLPLVPVYVSYLVGEAAGPGGAGLGRRDKAVLLLRQGSAFIAGFLAVFLLLGIAAGAVGQYLAAYRDLLVHLGGAGMVLFGLVVMDLLEFPLLEGPSQVGQGALVRIKQWSGLARGVGLGVVLGLAWTPCVGPILGAILTLAATQADVTTALVLLGVYGAGMAIPFFILAMTLQWTWPYVSGVLRYTPVLRKIAGVVLVVAGLLLLFDRFDVLQRL